MTLPSLRLTWFGGCLISVGLIIIGYWLEMHDGILPCPLCSLQRLAFIALGCLFLFGCFFRNSLYLGHVLTGILASLVSALGLWLAGRQVWLQWLPPERNEDCSVSLAYLLKVLPLDKALQKAMNGSAECSKVIWSFLHLSLAEWSLVFFVGLLVLSIIQTARALR